MTPSIKGFLFLVAVGVTVTVSAQWIDRNVRL